MRYTIFAGIVIIFWGCSSDIEPVSPNSQSPFIQDDYPLSVNSTVGEGSPDSPEQPDTTSEGLNSDCDICIDPPGDGDPTICTPPDQYRLEASINGNGAYIYNSNIPTWRFTPFWGGIIQETLEELENFEQSATNLLKPAPYHQTFDLDYRLKAVTTVMPNGKLNFMLKFYDIHARLWFQKTTLYTSNAVISVEAEAFQIEGIYSLSSDNFSVSNFNFENLDVDIDIGGFLPLIDDIKCFFSFGNSCTISNAEGSIETAIKNEILSAIDQINDNSPNMFIRSLVNYPETTNLLAVFDQAINKLLQDNVSATLNIKLPSCGDITRDGLIKLEIDT